MRSFQALSLSVRGGKVRRDLMGKKVRRSSVHKLQDAFLSVVSLHLLMKG